MHKPAWRNPPVGLGPETPTRYPGDDPLALAAIQWQEVVLSTRIEAEQLAPDRYTEVAYERLVSDPHTVLDELLDFAELPASPSAHDFVEDRLKIRDMNAAWQGRLSAADVERITPLMADGLKAYGYPLDPGAEEAAGEAATGSGETVGAASSRE
jgi:hypothetical protein